MDDERDDRPVLYEFARDYPLEDIRILSRAQGQEYADGRTVEALVAVFDRTTEIADHQGHYLETINRTAFDRVLTHARPQGSRARWNVGVFYNHAMTLHGTPSDRGSVPIGSPVDIRVDPAGLVTVTRYNSTPLADDVLESIRAGDITGHSFSGRIVKSDPMPPRGGFRESRTGSLTTVRRLELGFREYGPTPQPAYADTAVLSVRSFLPTTQRLVEDDELDGDSVDSGTPSDEGLAPDDSPSDTGHSSRDPDLARVAVLQKIAMVRRTRPGLTRQGDTP